MPTTTSHQEMDQVYSDKKAPQLPKQSQHGNSVINDARSKQPSKLDSSASTVKHVYFASIKF